MKIGILTWHDVLNYGSAFQAYALQKTLIEYGNETYILSHDRKMPDYYSNKKQGKGIVGILRWLRNQTPNRRKNRLMTKRKCEGFQSFYQNELLIQEHYSSTTVDKVVIGSDQIFDIAAFYYPFQFGVGVSCTDINAYAPSFGETTRTFLNDFMKKADVEKGLKEMRVVTARDENTRSILGEVLGRDVPLVLDPVLLYGFSKEKQTWAGRMVAEKYCLVYTWGGYTTEDSFAKACVDFAHRHDLKLVSVGEIRPWCDIQFPSADPIEFFKLVKYADMVLTNMFHGTCFSIVLERPFYSFVCPHNRHKVAGILTELHLENNMKNSPDELYNEDIPEMDYYTINILLEEKRKISRGEIEKIVLG